MSVVVITSLDIVHGVVGIKLEQAQNMSRSVDLDIVIRADIVDYKCVPWLFTRSLTDSSMPPSTIANQGSLSDGLETEMRKMGGIVKEIVNELGCLEKRELEERFGDANRQSYPWTPAHCMLLTLSSLQ
jgi:hypothetical protein